MAETSVAMSVATTVPNTEFGREVAETTGIWLSEEQAARFVTYRDTLLAWNQRVNLTAIEDPIGIEQRLFLDALQMVSSVDRYGLANGATTIHLVDVGSGAGFPGLPLKIVRPDLDVTLIEATGKKVAFLHHVIDLLGLTGIRALHGRAESFAHDQGHRQRYDLATARAVASLPALLELCLPLLRIGGRGLFPKGLEIAEERDAAERAAVQLGGRIEAVSELPGGQTRLVEMVKCAPTPRHYPRRAGIPSRDPLGVARARPR